MPESTSPEPRPQNSYPVEKYSVKLTDIEKGFTFYKQNLQGQTDVWNEMIAGLRPDSLTKGISGLIWGNTLIWSDDAVRHMSLAQAAGEDYVVRDMEIQSKYEEGDRIPTLRVFDYNNKTDELEKYLQRSISSETPINVMVSYSLFADPKGERARRLNVGKSEV